MWVVGNIPEIVRWILIVAIGWPLFRDVNRVLGLNLAELLAWRKVKTGSIRWDGSDGASATTGASASVFVFEAGHTITLRVAPMCCKTSETPNLLSPIA